MNQRRLVIMLAWCFMNWICVILVSAQDDDTRIAPETVHHDVVMEVPAENDTNSHHQTSEINETYPREEYKSHENSDDNNQEETDVPVEHDDGIEMEPSVDQSDHIVTQARHNDEPLDADETTSDSAQTSHENPSSNNDEGKMAYENTTHHDTDIPSHTKETMEEHMEGGHQTEPYEGTDELEADSAMLVDGEGEESFSGMEHIQEMQEHREETLDHVENGEASDEIPIQLEEMDEQVQESTSTFDEDTSTSEDISTENDKDDEVVSENDVNIQPDSPTEPIVHDNWETEAENQSTTPDETSPETESATEQGITIDDAASDDGLGLTSPETDVDLNEESHDSNDETSATESMHAGDEPTEWSTENEVIHENSSESEGESLTKAESVASEPHSPTIEEDSSAESIDPVDQNQDFAQEKEEMPIEQQTNDNMEAPSYRGLWGTPVVGSRPPDMELLYHVFESRIQEQLGIGPIPESELREHIFPLGIGHDENLDSADFEAANDNVDGTSPSEAKDAGDANSKFVEGLDDIDKFFEGVDPPDELDVGASGSSMQDMLVKKGKEILIKRILMGVKLAREGFVIARTKVMSRFAELKQKDIDFQEIAKTVVSKTTKAYEAVVGFVDNLLDFGSDKEAAEDFEVFKRKTMEDLQRQDVR